MEANDDHLYIGTRRGWGSDVPASLSVRDRAFHTYILGKSGSGKSTLLRNLIAQEIALGSGVGLIDPHGDLAAEVLELVPKWRTDHVAYMNPADEEFPMAFNPFAGTTNPALKASAIVAAFKHIWGDSWGPRLEYILYATVAALVECPNTTFLGIPRMFHDDRYRRWVVRQVRNPMVRSFFINEFDRYDPKFLREAVAPIQNKVGQLLMAPALRNILGQVKNKIDFRFIMDHSRIFVANLSKGLMGEDKSNLLGALLVSQFQAAALSRADSPKESRAGFSLFIDEFHNFCSDSFAAILAEARKYGLNLTLAHQYLAQVPEPYQNAVFGNVGNLVAFQVGSLDAERLTKEFGDVLRPSIFAGLNKYEAYVRSIQNGEAQPPWFVKMSAPIFLPSQARDRLISRSRERFGTARGLLEPKLATWIAQKSEHLSAKSLGRRR